MNNVEVFNVCSECRIGYFMNKSNTVREQPTRLCKNNNPKINCESAKLILLYSVCLPLCSASYVPSFTSVRKLSCEARYVGRTTQRLADRIKQHVPTSIRKKHSTVREQPPRVCKNISSKINCKWAIGQHLITNPECAKTYTEDNFRIIG